MGLNAQTEASFGTENTKTGDMHDEIQTDLCSKDRGVRICVFVPSKSL